MCVLVRKINDLEVSGHDMEPSDHQLDLSSGPQSQPVSQRLDSVYTHLLSRVVADV